jgi:outer membrane protein TolC
VRQFHAILQAVDKQVKALELSVSSAEKAYRMQVQEYKLGIENNINVLAALDALVTARRSLDRARANRAAGVARLAAASGLGPWAEGV